MDGVVRVHAFGSNGRVIVMLADGKAFDQKEAEKALKDVELRLRKMKKTGSSA